MSFISITQVIWVYDIKNLSIQECYAIIQHKPGGHMFIRGNKSRVLSNYQTCSDPFYGLFCPPGQWVVLEQGEEKPVKKNLQNKMTDKERRGYGRGSSGQS